MQKTSVLRFHTSGNRDPFRQGYQYRQRVAGPIEPIAQPSFWQRVKSRVTG